ncbi:MAG: NAD(P)/FAD-dependent oxidoreductase [Candidatus Marinimicrobia bacterium]|nr:NAD(P)/FAD-dependent oxidoreductase [Candidatus Neomarinimicrobiota bacterium]
MENIYDVILIGAGSAGLFAANRLAGSGLKVLVIDRGDEPEKRKDMNFGVGGAGTFSDGKLNLSHRIGGDPSSFGRSASEVEEYIELVDDIFTELGVVGGYTGTNDKSFQELMRKAHAVGVDFIYAKQRHIGTDRLHVIANRFYQRLVKKGISFRVNTRIRSIDYLENIFVLANEKEQFRAQSIIAAPGRAGAYWLREQAKKLGIQNMYGPIDVGVRVEFPADIYSEIAKIMYDAKFRLYTKSYDDLVRTFCTNPNGYIVKEEFDDFVLVNGHAKWNSKTNNTNFALLSRVTLTDPVEDTTKYGRDIARLATTIGGGKPILQRLTDFVSGHRSTWDRIAKSAVTPTLTDVTPGDIAMAFPQRIVTNLMEGLSVLNQIISGLQSNSTLLYAPEIKFYDTKYTVTPNLETNVNNFFVAGDASGHSRGIIYSAVTGIFAAEGVLRNLGKS